MQDGLINKLRGKVLEQHFIIETHEKTITKLKSKQGIDIGTQTDNIKIKAVVQDQKLVGPKVDIKSLRAIISRNRSHDGAVASSKSPP